MNRNPKPPRRWLVAIAAAATRRSRLRRQRHARTCDAGACRDTRARRAHACDRRAHACGAQCHGRCVAPGAQRHGLRVPRRCVRVLRRAGRHDQLRDVG